MQIARRALLALLALSYPTLAHAEEAVPELVGQLAKSPDFRVRVKAALALGKIHDRRCRPALEKALGDPSPAVRAAAAAALRVLGEVEALPALRRRTRDASPAVRSQIASTIAALEKKAESMADKPDVVVKLGELKIAEPGAESMLTVLQRESRDKLEELPGVLVVPDWEDWAVVANAHAVPCVMVTGLVKALATSRDGSQVVCSAKVEFVFHTMPGKVIVGTVSGAASARVAAAEAANSKRAAQLRRQALAAAVNSAVSRAPAAIKAAAV